MTEYDQTPPPPRIRREVIRSLRRQGLVRPPVVNRIARGVAISGVAAALVFIGARLDSWTEAGADGSPRFLLLLYEGESFQSDESHVREYAAWAGSLHERGALVVAEKLGDKVEALGDVETLGDVESEAPSMLPTGFFLIRAESLRRAVEIARGSPHLRYGGWVVVKPIEET